MRRTGVFLGIIAVVLFLFLPAFAQSRSDLALSIQRKSFEKDSVFSQQGLAFEIPTGDPQKTGGWCHKMKLYHPGSGFFKSPDQGQMSILYNFANFNKGRSRFYDLKSDYFNAHYGVYAIALEEKRFGYQPDGRLDEEAISNLVAYDHLDLVMDSLGCPRSKRFFKGQITGVKENQELSGFSDWLEIDATD